MIEVMEKHTQHYKLPTVKAFIKARAVRSTFSALSGAAALGLDFAGVIEVTEVLTTRDFYKSMTTYSDSRTWQDVYRPHTDAGDVYMKLTAVDELLIVSFKEL